MVRELYDGRRLEPADRNAWLTKTLSLDNRMESLQFVTIEKEPTAAVLDAVRNVPRPYRLDDDQPIGEDFPAKAYFPMLPGYGLELKDFVNNQSDVLVVSGRVADFLAAQADVTNVEALPTTILDHKGREVEEPYFIAHLLNHQDCLDEEASEATVWASGDGAIRSVERLVLKEDCLDPEVSIFRLRRYPYPVLVRRDLAERIEAAGFTGVVFKDIADFDHFAIL